MNMALVFAGIAPVMLILALGAIAGRRGQFDRMQARALSRFALHFALPAALFLAMAQTNRAQLVQQIPAMLIMLAGYTGFFFVAYAVLRRFSVDRLRATLLAYTVSSTAAPIYGLTVLVPLFGQSVGSGVVGLAALVTNLAQVSVVIFMLQSASAAASATGDARPSLGRTITGALLNPLVWCPVLGALLAALNVHLPSMALSALRPLGVCAAGTAIFACGLVLASYRINLASRSVVLGSATCMIVHPLVFFLLVHFGGDGSLLDRAVFVAAVMPTATPTVLFAQAYGKGEAEIASIMLITTLAMVVTLPASLAISAFL